MQQYHDLLNKILTTGVLKSNARDGMPDTLSIFGHQMEFDLSEGFPLVTTKKISFKNIVIELLWFLRGDTNIKYLIDNGCNIWNEDAYNYYVKKCREQSIEVVFDFEEFITLIKNNNIEKNQFEYQPNNYTLGDCGKQYGWMWRSFGKKYNKDLGIIANGNEGGINRVFEDSEIIFNYDSSSITDSLSIKLELVYKDNQGIDQLKELIEGLKNNPMGRRHIITAWNPVTLDGMALNACHAFVQFNCRPLSRQDKVDFYNEKLKSHNGEDFKLFRSEQLSDDFDKNNFIFGKIPQYYLDCQLYQRSADTVLGVPYNITSYALLTEMLSKVCNMLPGKFIHTFGDAHIYVDHIPAVEEQLQRECRELPTLNQNLMYQMFGNKGIEHFNNNLNIDIIVSMLENYNPYPKLENETKLFTGLEDNTRWT